MDSFSRDKPVVQRAPRHVRDPTRSAVDTFPGSVLLASRLPGGVRRTAIEKALTGASERSTWSYSSAARVQGGRIRATDGKRRDRNDGGGRKEMRSCDGGRPNNQDANKPDLPPALLQRPDDSAKAFRQTAAPNHGGSSKDLCPTPSW